VSFDDAGGTLFATGIGAPGVPLETPAPGDEPCRLGLVAAADAFEGTAGMEGASLSGRAGEISASLAVRAADCGRESTAGALADDAVLGREDAGVAVALASGAPAR
jgi:hypothetical protein